MELADLIAIPNISARLKAPEKVGDKVLGSKPDAWCEFHQGFVMEEGPSSPHDESQASKTRRSSL